MKKMLVAVVCLSMVGSALAIREEAEDAGMSPVERLIIAIDKLTLVDQQIPRVTLFMDDARTAADALERAYAGVKVLSIIYDAVLKPLVDIAKGIGGLRGLAGNVKVQKFVKVVDKVNAELVTIPALANDLKDVIKARAAKAEEA